MRRKSSVNAGRQGHASWFYSLRLGSLMITGIVLLSLSMTMAVQALTSISQSYTTANKLPIGSIVSLQSNTQDHVVAAVNSNVDSLLGVVINSDSSLLSLTNGQENQVQIATSGTAAVLVSDINGEVLRGDYLTASPVAGIGMKATGNVRVIGTAQGNLKDAGGSKQTVKTKDGKEQTILVAQVPVLVNVSYYFKEPDKTLIPSALQNIANGLAGKSVNSLPILISAAIFVIMLIIVASIIYSMIRSSIISIGRNPMSQSAVYRDLIQLSGLVLVILAIGLVAIYLVLVKL